jgi:hypothetical protein
MNEPKFSIGQQYRTRGKSPKLCTVVDILRTVNSRGEVVKLRYVAMHDSCGQLITDYDVREITIAMGITKEAS